MILTKLDRESAYKILELGKMLHTESHFSDQPYDVERCKSILEATLKSPDKAFIAFDEDFRGFIIMGMNHHYFSGFKYTADLALYIVPEYRNGLLAPRLIKAAEEWSKEHGAIEMTIFHHTGINTESAQPFFNRLGYKTKGYIFTKEFEPCAV